MGVRVDADTEYVTRSAWPSPAPKPSWTFSLWRLWHPHGPEEGEPLAREEPAPLDERDEE